MKLYIVAALCLVVGIAGTARAQNTQDSSKKEKIATALLRASYGATVGVQLYDAHTTLGAIDAGAHETNPVILPFGTSPTAVLLTGLGRAAAIDLAVHSIGQRHKFIAIGIAAALNSAYLAVAVHNNSVAADMRRQQVATVR